MNLLVAEEITKSYTDRELFNQIRLTINEGDKIGLIGVNGSGKSTFLKILAGVETPQSGKVTLGHGVRIIYLSQHPDFDSNLTVLEQVLKGDSEVLRLVREYEEALQGSVSTEVILRLNSRMDALDAWNFESEVKSVLSKLGITDYQKRMGSLSGGQRKRVALAYALLHPADLLIFDEPTNHLDSETIDWLEQYLSKRTLIMVTHDRYFLDRVANKIVELDQGNLFTYEGNYSKYLEEKAEREELSLKTEAKRRSLYKQELAWMRQGAQARSTKQKARIDRFHTLSETLTHKSSDALEISVAGSRLGKKVIECVDVSFGYGDKLLLENFNTIIGKNERIGIIGPNGSGKTTLMNILSGGLTPDKGIVEIGPTVKFGYYRQEMPEMDRNLRAIEYIKEVADMVETSDGEAITVSQMMERFLFNGALQWTQINKLSGGEKRRLYLLRVLMEAPNVLLFDEPTNDLDIDTLKILEDYLDDFLGTVIVVSHDRYFLDRTVEQLLVFETNGGVVPFTGGYSDYQAKERQKQKDISSNSNLEDKGKSYRQEKKLKFSFQEQKEYDSIDEEILSLEEQIEQTKAAMAEAYADYVKLQELTERLETIEEALAKKMERWVYLNELQERIDEQKKK